MRMTRTRLLLLLVTALAVTLASAVAPPAAQALICPEGSTLGIGTIYYTTAAKTVIFCVVDPCGGDDCNGQTTPYIKIIRGCC
jgi:hypothetical protein